MDQQQTREFICAEVKKQVTPLIEELAEVKRQNSQQSSALTLHGKQVEKLDRWSKQLWSNGSGGPPGYLEVARKQDDERYEKLFDSISKLKAEGFRQEGRDELLEDQDVEKDKKLVRLKNYALVASSFGGAWLFKPVFHSFIAYIVKQLQ